MCRVLLVTRGFCGGFCKWVGKERGNQRCGRGGAFLEKRTDLWYGDEDGSRFGGCVENGPNGLCAGQQSVVIIFSRDLLGTDPPLFLVWVDHQGKVYRDLQ